MLVGERQTAQECADVEIELRVGRLNVEKDDVKGGRCEKVVEGENLKRGARK